jgi:hypothetical protein
MKMLGDDDLNLREMTEEELDLAWDLWFDLAQETNGSDPPYTHGVFVLAPPPPGTEDGRRGAAGHLAGH